MTSEAVRKPTPIGSETAAAIRIIMLILCIGTGWVLRNPD